jgi:hypothetical protein
MATGEPKKNPARKRSMDRGESKKPTFFGKSVLRFRSAETKEFGNGSYSAFSIFDGQLSGA